MFDATVIIAAWCAENSLARSIDSALAQVEVSVEVIIVDDASPDRTSQIAKTYADRDSCVSVIRQTRNAGPSAARNAGVAAACGTWLAVLDADDAMAPNRLARMITLGEHKGAAVVFDDFQPINADGKPVGASHLAPYRLAAPVRWDLEAFLEGCQAEAGRPSLGYLKPILRRDTLMTHRISYDETLRNGEDFHLIADILAAGEPLWVLPEAGYLYTVGKGSISNRLNPTHAKALAAADAGFLERYKETLDPRDVALMQRRMKRLGDLATAEEVLQSLRSMRLGPAVSAFLRRPRATGRLLQQSWAVLQRRLTRFVPPQA